MIEEIQYVIRKNATNSQRRVIASILEAMIPFVTGVVLGGVTVLGECTPLAVAFTGVCGAGLRGVMSLIGAACGYTAFFGLGGGVQYIAAAVMTYTVSFVCQYLPVYRTKWFMPFTVIVMVGLTVAFGAVSTVRSDLPFWLRLGFEVLVSGVFAYLYCGLPSAMLKTAVEWTGEEFMSAVVFGGSVLAVLAEYSVWYGLSAGRILACVWMVSVAFRDGRVGCAIGTGVGLVMDLVAGAPYYYTMTYALASLMCGVVRLRSKILYILVYFISAAFAVMLCVSPEQMHGVVCEMVLGGMIFLFIPKRLYQCTGVFSSERCVGHGESRLRRYTAKRIEQMSAALAAVGSMLQEPHVTYPEIDVEHLFDRAAEAVCVGCSRKAICWTNHYLDMLVIFGDAVPMLQRRGCILESDLPEYFRNYCVKYQELILAINYELRRGADRRLMYMKQRELTEAGASQYADFAEILRELSEGLKGELGTEGECERKLWQYLTLLDLDCQCAIYRDFMGRMRILLHGKDLNRLLSRSDYLNEVSKVIGLRLCCPEMRPGQNTLLLLEAEPYAVSIGIASRKKRGESVSGDRGRYFKTDSGRLYVILSDGLGAGDSAAEQSSTVVEHLEQLLRSGLSPMSSMKLVNSAMLLKNRQEWGYATVDLLAVNLFTGEATFLKYGAAPSYVWSREEVQMISGQSLSAGMVQELLEAPDAESISLNAGDLVVLVSDGISIDDTQRLKLLIQREGTNMRHLAREILLSTDEEASDDMTVIVIGLEERK